jgi:arabinose-5-phosphate isomerase
MLEQHQIYQCGKNAIASEIKALQHLHERMDEKSFTQACQLILESEGKVIVTGVGKSGHIGNKIASTFASTGTPSFFVHPGEAAHGDLGMFEDKDIVLAISHSGESPEIQTIIPMIKRKGMKIISLTGQPNSTLAQLADINLSVDIPQEACPLGLAPTSSTTATLVMGDALAVALLSSQGFTDRDFALSHPGGYLGKKLLLRIKDIMHQAPYLPIVSERTTISNTLLEMTNKSLGMTAVVNSEGQLTGIFTDGDLRRALDQKIDIHAMVIEQVMTKKPLTLAEDLLATEALNFMEENDINGFFVLNKNQQPIGALNMLDLVKSGIF